MNGQVEWTVRVPHKMLREILADTEEESAEVRIFEDPERPGKLVASFLTFGLVPPAYVELVRSGGV